MDRLRGASSELPRPGVHKVDVPWADGWPHFTVRFEIVAFDWLKEASVSAVARNLSIS